MNAIVSSPSFAAPRLRRTSPLASVAALRAWAPAAPVLRPLHLERGNVVRIRAGGGALVHVRSGIVWITEEHSPRDVFLVQGESHRVDRTGLTIVHADRTARIVVELSGAAARDARIEIARRYGEVGHPVGRVEPRSTVAAHVWELFAALRHALWRWRGTPRFPASWSEARRQRPEDAFTPEAVRDRLLQRASPLPYY